MEVHHHSNLHHTAKAWKEYLLEFLMIFLAVTLGFFASNYRESLADHAKEKEYMISMAEDLKMETNQIRLYMSFNENILRYCDSVQHCIASTDIFKNSNGFYNYTRELARYIRYYPADRTMQQLKNAGEMRLIRKWNVSKALVEYAGKTNNLKEIDQQLNEQIIKYRTYLIEFLDLSSYDQSNPFGSFMDGTVKTMGNPGFIRIDPGKAKIIYNQAFTLKAFLSTVEMTAEEVNGNANQLLQLIQKEYSIK